MAATTATTQSDTAKAPIRRRPKRSAGVGLGILLACIGLLWCGSEALAQHDHMDLWSTEDGGGRLVAEWDFGKKIQVFQSFCAPNDGPCLYTSINPAFLAPTEDEPGDDSYRIRDDTRLSLEIVAIDPALTISVNGNRLNAPGRAATLGIMPNIHNHPSWQLLVPKGEIGDYTFSFKFRADSPAYSESEVYTAIVTNDAPTPAPTATATPPPTRVPCPGDCNSDGAVSVGELVEGINEAIGNRPVSCGGLDADAGGVVTIDEVMVAVGMALGGCPAEPTPVPVDFQRIQDEILTPNCLGSGCHNARDRVQNLVLEDGQSRQNLVGVTPANFAAASAGFLRVDPGRPETSFLLTKLQSPRPEFGSRMPLDRPALSAAEIELIRNWILQGAPE
jgi:hypothetical protein